MSTNAEMVDELNILNTQMQALRAQVEKVGEEISHLKTKIDELESVINAGGDVSPEVTAALAAVQETFKGVQESVQVADDLTPDAEPVPPIP